MKNHATAFRLTAFLLISIPILAVTLFAFDDHLAHAATITVNTTADELNSDGDCSLREAIQAANANAAVDACPAGSGTDTINVPPGTYTLTIAGQGEDGNATGDLDIRDPIEIAGAGAASTIIDGGHVDSVLDVPHPFSPPGGCGCSAFIHGLTIQNAAIFGVGVIDGVLRLEDVVVQNNDSTGVISLRAFVALTRVVVTGNLDHGVFWRGVELTIKDSTISNNTAQPLGQNDGTGAGICCGNGTASFENVTVSGNRGPGDGGGIAVRFVTILSLTNVTVSGNVSGTKGGGIWNCGQLDMTNVTIAGNTAASGGGLLEDTAERCIGVAPTSLMKNVILADSTGGNCVGGASMGHNLSDDGTCPFTQPGDLSNTDPLLGPLQNNGGFTETHALLPGSPAIDAASSDCPPPPTDQRGVARPQDGDGDSSSVCDIGAFELEASSPPGGDEGCTPGYWKQEHHFDSWIGYAPSEDFDTVFGRDAFTTNKTLLEALQGRGGGFKALARHAVAALLNASHPDVEPDSPYDTTAAVIAAFQAAFDSGAYEATKNSFEASNQNACPLT